MRDMSCFCRVKPLNFCPKMIRPDFNLYGFWLMGAQAGVPEVDTLKHSLFHAVGD
jgi:hypothetical protein